MNTKYLLNYFENELSMFNTNFAEIKKGITLHGAYGVGNAMYPIGNLIGLRWIISALKELNYNTTELDKKLTELNSEVEKFNNENGDEYSRILFSDLKKLIDYYEDHFKDFQEEKNNIRTTEGIDPLYKDYFLKREEGLFFPDEYEFENAITTRTYIENLFEYLSKDFDVTQLRDKVKKLDNIFKRDMKEILKILKIDESFITQVSYAPTEYWWLST